MAVIDTQHEGSAPDISVVIPVYNRGELVRHTIESVRRASTRAAVEFVLVDDGSTTPLAEDLQRLGIAVDQVIRQPNRGLLFARLAGLAAARGRLILFLDSDDLVSADKLEAHVAAHRDGADISYTDSARQLVDALRGPVSAPEVERALPETDDAAEFFLMVQPAPHSPAFRTEYLKARVAAAAFPPAGIYNSAAEVWFYHICAPFPARVVKCPGQAIVGRHAGARLTDNWERVGVASLAIQEAFARSCPATDYGRHAYSLFAARAFQAWRRLPRGLPGDFSQRLLRLFSRAPVRPPASALGGGLFRHAASLLGPINAGRLFRLWQSKPYASSRTLDDTAFATLLHQLPPP